MKRATDLNKTWLMAGAAVAVVVIGGAVFLMTRDGAPPSTPVPASAEAGHEGEAAGEAKEGVITLTPAQIDSGEGREVVLKFPGAELKFKGEDYLLHFVLPNFYFHVTTAYGILRQAGVKIGKLDFLGPYPQA